MTHDHGPRLFFLVVIAACAAGAGCQRSFVQLCEDRLALECRFQFTCCTDEERVTEFGAIEPYVTTEQECRDRLTSLCPATSAALDDAAAIGRLRLDDEARGKCIAALEDEVAGCRRRDDVNELCDAAAVGLVDNGADCRDDTECADGFCRFGAEIDLDNETRIGECAAFAGRGEACESTPCEAELVCVPDVDGALCDDPAPPAQQGEPCGNGCDDGLFCADDGSCATLLGEGDACTFDGACASGRCDDDDDACVAPVCDG